MTIRLAIGPQAGQTLRVTRWQIIGLAAVGALGLGYLIVHRPAQTVAHLAGAGADGEPSTATTHPAPIEWQKVDRSGDGFKIEMPAGEKQIQLPAYTESGATQPFTMILSNPDAETTFSLAWQDEPPVARGNGQADDKVLDAARDGAMAHTQTSLVSETANRVQGYPGRLFEARNTGGGVMNSQLIYTGRRLYMLTACFPSVTARRDRDVTRFFHSFTITSSNGNGKDSTTEPQKGV